MSIIAKSPWGNGVCERMVGMIKEGLGKVTAGGGVQKYDDVDCSSKKWSWNEGKFSSNQLVSGRNPILNLMGKNTPISLERSENGDRRDGTGKVCR